MGVTELNLEGKTTIRIGFDDVDTWPEWCVRETRDCRQCDFMGKILCHPRFRVGVIRPPQASGTQAAILLLKQGKKPLEVHQLTGVPLQTLYSIGQKLRRKGELEWVQPRHPKQQKEAILAYVREHPDEQYKDIAPLFDVEPSFISRLSGKAGIHRRAYLRAKKERVVDDAIRMLESDPSRSIASVAEAFHIAPTTLAYCLRRKGKLPINHEARVFLESVRREVIAAVLEAFRILKRERIIIVERTVESDSRKRRGKGG